MVTTLFVTSSPLMLATVDVSDLGVPAGWSANDYNNRGNDLDSKGHYNEAIKYYDAALRTAPNEFVGHYNRASTYIKLRNWNAALQDLNSTIRLQPAFFEASWVRSGVYLTLGNYQASLKDLNALARETVRVGNSYGFGLTLDRRAWIRATCPDASIRNGQLAVTDAKKACQLSKWSNNIDTLAAGYAETGDFDSAIRYEEQAINLRKAEHDETEKKVGALKEKKSDIDRIADEVAKADKASLQGYVQRLALYKHRRPFRENPTR
jgi:tetratricopeptide (TPR) repeat protein